MFCRSLFVLLHLFVWPLCFLFFFALRIIITPLVSSNSSYLPICHLLLPGRIVQNRSSDVLRIYISMLDNLESTWISIKLEQNRVCGVICVTISLLNKTLLSLSLRLLFILQQVTGMTNGKLYIVLVSEWVIVV